MPDTITPNYSLIKPEITGSIDTWGNKSNGNFDKIDTALFGIDAVADGALQKSGAVEGRTALDYILLKDTLTPTEDFQLITVKAAKALLNALMPIGTIIMWYGTAATIPAGWALCNGQVVGGNTTPNLLNRFVIGGGGTFAPGFSGGSSVFSYSGSVGGHVLTINEIPAHAHAVYDPTHTHTINDNGHRHTGTFGSATPETGFGSTGGSVSSYGTVYTSTVTAGVYNSYAATSISLYNNGSSWAHDHPISLAIPAGATGAWYPPFYAICYIMKVALA